METVGVRELKNNLSKYLKKVRSGDSLVVTDRKKEIALIVPRNAAPVDEEVVGLMQRGIADWSGGKPAGMSQRISPKGKSISDAVLEDRR